MRKGKKWLATAALAAMVGIGSMGVMSTPSSAINVNTKNDVVVLQSLVNSCGTKGTIYISKQALGADGVDIDIKAFADLFPGGLLNQINNGTSQPTTVTLTIKNGKFVNYNDLALVLDNGTLTTINPSSASSTSISFSVNDPGKSFNRAFIISNSGNIKIHVNGGLKVGDRVEVNLSSGDGNGNSVNNGCVKRDLAIIEDQFVAHSCFCNNGQERSDTDLIVMKDDGVITLMDDERGEEGYALYNACEQVNGNCCPTVPAACGLTCNVQVVTQGQCVLPDLCVNSNQAKGLTIYQNRDFDPAVAAMAAGKYVYALSAEELDGSTLKLTLKATGVDLTKVVDKIIVTDYTGQNQLATFNIVDSNTATADVVNLFKSENKERLSIIRGPNRPVGFSIKIVPKEGVYDIKPATFSLSGVLSGGSMKNEQKLDWGQILSWQYNNLFTYTAPYVRQDNLVTSVIRIENASPKKAKVNVYVNDPNGNGWVFVKHFNLAPGEVTADSVLTGDKIINYAKDAGVTLDGSKGFAVRILSDVGPDELNVYGSQQMVTTGSFRPLPINIGD